VAADQQPIACTLTADDLRGATTAPNSRYSFDRPVQQVGELMREEQACWTF
jgi:hypothetical protein